MFPLQDDCPTCPTLASLLWSLGHRSWQLNASRGPGVCSCVPLYPTRRQKTTINEWTRVIYVYEDRKTESAVTVLVPVTIYFRQHLHNHWYGWFNWTCLLFSPVHQLKCNISPEPLHSNNLSPLAGKRPARIGRTNTPNGPQ